LQLYDGVAMRRQCFGAKGISGCFSILWCVLFLSVLVVFARSILSMLSLIFYIFFSPYDHQSVNEWLLNMFFDMRMILHPACFCAVHSVTWTGLVSSRPARVRPFEPSLFE
jgi:hypothetical protein